MKKRILVVDDEFSAVQLIKINLETAGHEVITAYTGREAIEKAKTEIPDLITLDLMLKDMNGFEVMREIKSIPELKKIPILLVSGMEDTEQKEKSFDLGAAAYMTKPIEMDNLLSRINDLDRYLENLCSGDTNKKVLIVDDEEVIINVLKDVLQEKGFTVLSSSNGAQAVKMVKEENPALVLLDLLMPGMTGLEVLKILKSDETTKKIPVFIITLMDVLESKKKCMALGASEYISKSDMSVDMLFAKINKHLE